MPAGSSTITKIQALQVVQYLDLTNVMTYDMHGGWEPTEPANFQAPLYDSARSPTAGRGLTANDAIKAYLRNGFLPTNRSDPISILNRRVWPYIRRVLECTTCYEPRSQGLRPPA
jgi:GH18 family chitinase